MFYEVTGPHGLKHDPFNAVVAPRPIGWISTLSREGIANLAPFSYFNAIAARPAMVAFAANGHHADGGFKDTLRNTLDTGEFVVNLATWELRQAMNQSSRAEPRAVDEFEVAGLEKAECRIIKAPRVARSPVNLECRFLQLIELPPDPTSGRPNQLAIGSVVGVHIDDAIIRDGMIDIAAFRPLARLGYLDYAVVTETFEMARP
jgi:flavin reductase (DIM6/NTAB) family NADH-FMN oxidoreductase RutF